MPLTSRDETDLLLPLFSGMREERRFSGFLERLRRRTEAEYVGLIIRHGNRPLTEATELFAGRDLRAQARAAGMPEPLALDRLQYEQLRPGRVYSMSELIEHDQVYRAERARQMRKLDLADERVIRLGELERATVWFVLARAAPCSAADAALLSNLAPYIAEAVRTMIALERQQMEVRISAAGLARSGMAWLLFDKDAHVIAIDPEIRSGAQTLDRLDVRMGERLRGIAPAVERELVATATACRADPAGKQHTMLLRDDPRIEALLLPFNDIGNGTAGEPAMLALCRLQRAGSSERIAQLTQLLGLPRREAELAIALSDGLSITDAARTMGLTIETARNYSKRIYAKLGVRGQADLVRFLHESVIALA